MEDKKVITASDTLDIINHVWADTKDIMLLANVGYNKALEIRKDIVKILENNGYKLFNNLIPMHDVVEYLGIDIDFLKRVTR